MLPTFVWAVPVEEKNGQGVTVLTPTEHFHRRDLCFHVSSVASGATEGIFQCWLQRKMEMYAKYTSLNKANCSSPGASGGVCVCELVTLPWWSSVTCTAVTPHNMSLSPFLSRGEEAP